MDPNPDHRARFYRRMIFWLLAVAYMLVFFHRLCPAVVSLDIMRDLDTGGTLLGFLSAAYFYPYALMQIPAGLLSDSWGPRNTISVFYLLAFVGSVMLGLAPTVPWAVAGRTLVGFGVAMVFVPTLKILAEWYHPREFAFMTGILMAMGGIGSLSAATPLVVLSEWIGWRYSFVIVGVFTLLLAVLIRVIVRNRPADMGWPSPVDDGGKSQAAAIPLAAAVRRVVANGRFWPVAIWFFCVCGAFFTFGGLWGGPYLMQVHGLSKEAAGRILSMIAVGMIFGSPSLSRLSTKVFRARKPAVHLANGVFLVLAALLAFATETIPVYGLYLICFLMGFFPCSVVVVTFTLNKELFPVSMAGTATGLVNLFPFSGTAVMQPLLGWVLEQGGRTGGAFTIAGYQRAFLILFSAVVIGALSTFFFKETLKEPSP